MKKSNHVSRYDYDEEDWFTNKRQKAERKRSARGRSKRMDRALKTNKIADIVKECLSKILCTEKEIVWIRIYIQS